MNISWKNCFRVGISIFLLYLSIFYWESISSFISFIFRAATPVVVGLSIAYVLNILMSFYERHYFPKKANATFVRKSRRIVCVIGAFLTLCAILALFSYLIVPELISCLTFLVKEIPPLIEDALRSDWLGSILPKDTIKELSSVNWVSHLSSFANTITSGLGGAVDAVVTAVTSVVSMTITIFLSIIFSVYILFNKDSLHKNLKRTAKVYIPSKILGTLSYLFHVINDSFRKYIVGQCVEAVILGLLCMLGMWIFGFPYIAMVGALIAFTALIPVVGAYIGAAVGFIVMLTESPLKALLFLVFIIVLQQLEGNLIYPKVVGKSLGLPALWVLAAVTIGGNLAGVLGMLLGVPITAAIYKVVKDDIVKKERKTHDKQRKSA